jgi:putative ABC transport system permease protein
MMDEARDRARYRLLLRAYPKAHRQRSGGEMEEAFITLLFGVLLAFRTDAAGGAHLRDGTRAGISRGANRFGSALVVLQTAMAVALLVGGGLLMKSISGMRAQDYGFEPSNVLTVRVALPTESYDSKELSDPFWADITSRVAGVPGVSAVGTAQNHPLTGSNWGRTVRIAGHNTGEESGRSVRVTHASTELFQALDFTIAQGRAFSDADAAGPRVAIVNQAFVRRYLTEGEDPLSTTLLGSEESTIQVIGVVEDIIERGVDQAVQPALYTPIGQADIRTRSLVIRTKTEPTDFVSAV